MHTLHPTSGAVSGTSISNSPRGQVHGISSVPAIKTAVQRPDAIVREKGCGVVIILVVGVWRNDRKEQKEGAMLRVSMT